MLPPPVEAAIHVNAMRGTIILPYFEIHILVITDQRSSGLNCKNLRVGGLLPSVTSSRMILSRAIFSAAEIRPYQEAGTLSTILRHDDSYQLIFHYFL